MGGSMSSGSMPSGLRGKRVLLAGASRGIGENMAKGLAKEGCQLVLASRSVDDLSRVMSECQSVFPDDERRAQLQVFIHPCDVTKRGDLENLVAFANEKLGGIDICIANAGLWFPCEFWKQSLDDIERNFQTMITGPCILARLVLPDMVQRKSGQMVFTSSIYGLISVPYLATYCAAKFAVTGLVYSLRRELKGTGVQAWEMAPGMIEGPEGGIIEHFKDEVTSAGKGGFRWGAWMFRSTTTKVTQGMIKNIKALGRKAVVVVTPTPAWPHLVLQTMCPDFYQSMQMRGFFPGAIGEFFQAGAEARQKTMIGTSGKESKEL